MSYSSRRCMPGCEEGSYRLGRCNPESVRSEVGGHPRRRAERSTAGTSVRANESGEKQGGNPERIRGAKRQGAVGTGVS